MLIKINKKPIEVSEEPETESKSFIYYCINYTGYALILYLLDYVCYTFFYYHPLPWITFIGKILSFLGGIL
jgi:hypothetical protein